jgi:transcriptional regulator GlxA family with amidase domain
VARTAVHRIGIVVFDGVKLLDVAGPSEVFSEANRMGAHYELTLCAVGGGPSSPARNTGRLRHRPTGRRRRRATSGSTARSA